MAEVTARALESAKTAAAWKRARLFDLRVFVDMRLIPLLLVLWCSVTWPARRSGEPGLVRKRSLWLI